MTTRMIRVLIVDDHTLVREGLKLLLKPQADLEVVGMARDGIEALEQARKLQPDLVLLDIAMPRMNGVEAVGLICEASPQSRVIILSMYEKEVYARQALSAGARGYVFKGALSEELLTAVRTVVGGDYYFSRRIHAAMIENYLSNDAADALPGGYDELSEREKQVFRLLVEGNSNQGIGQILCVSAKTVEKHRASIVRKLGISNPLEMVKYAIRIRIRIGIVDPDAWSQ